MTILEAILLGIIQGFTEFLPISSTGHLTVSGKLMSLISEEKPEQWTAFIAIIQLGTLVSILVYFWKDIYHITINFIRQNIIERKSIKEQNKNSIMGWFIIIGTIPIVIIGLGLKDLIEGELTKNLYVVSASLIVLALILAFAERVATFKKGMEEITWKDALVIGLAQCIALIPGSSRSGTTITGALFMGLKRETAARFSFLLSIPSIFASGVLQLFESLKFIDQLGITNLIIATIVSGISGYIAIDFLLKYLRKNSTFIFIYYRIALGVTILSLLYFNIIQP